MGLQIPLRDIHLEQRINCKHPKLAILCTLDVSHAFDAFRRPRLCGFISLHCHVQDSPSGVSTPLTVARARRSNHSLSSFTGSCLKAVAHFRQLLPLRPQGFCPVSESVPLHAGCSPTPRVDPLLVFPPPGFHPKQHPMPSHVVPPYTLSYACHCHACDWSLATAASIGLSLPKLPTCSRFLAYAPNNLATVRCMRPRDSVVT